MELQILKKPVRQRRRGGLEQLGMLTVYERTPADENLIAGRIGDAEAVYTNKVPLSRQVLACCPSIRFIGVLATGYNVVDETPEGRLLWKRIWQTP